MAAEEELACVCRALIVTHNDVSVTKKWGHLFAKDLRGVKIYKIYSQYWLGL